MREGKSDDLLIFAAYRNSASRFCENIAAVVVVHFFSTPVLIFSTPAMRRPLKFQIMVPMAAVMLLTLAVVASIDVWFAGRHARGQL